MEKINSHKAIFTLDILALKLYNVAIKQNTLQGSHPARTLRATGEKNWFARSLTHIYVFSENRIRHNRLHA